jgi:hypothetical protein
MRNIYWMMSSAWLCRNHTTWTGTCDALSNITQPILVAVRADDAAALDSLTLA